MLETLTRVKNALLMRKKARLKHVWMSREAQQRHSRVLRCLSGILLLLHIGKQSRQEHSRLADVFTIISESITAQHIKAVSWWLPGEDTREKILFAQAESCICVADLSNKEKLLLAAGFVRKFCFCKCLYTLFAQKIVFARVKFICACSYSPDW